MAVCERTWTHYRASQSQQPRTRNRASQSHGDLGHAATPPPTSGGRGAKTINKHPNDLTSRTGTSCRQAAALKATRSQIRSQCGPRNRCNIMSTNCCSKATRSQITSQFGPRDRCDIMSTTCCSLKGNWIPNHISLDQGIAATSCRRTVAPSKATRSQIRSLSGPRDRGVRRAQHQIGCNAR